MVILLTGCIDPNGMLLTTLNNKEERKDQYIRSIHYYLSKTKYPIVFVENSNTDISSLFQEHIDSKRLEIMTFDGNKDKSRGKGYGECEIIQYALDHSILIRATKDQIIIKITGRLIVRNINRIINLYTLLLSHYTVSCAINSDFTFPDSRLIIAPTDFYQSILELKEEINDSLGYYFEHALCDTIKNNSKYPYCPLLYMPYIEGISGSTGKKYIIEKKSIIDSIKYTKYALTQKIKFDKRFR